MNEEIFKRLQDQCWIYPTHPDMIDTDSNGEVRPCGFDTKKFAELIVKECINEIHDADVGDLKGKGYYLDRVAEHIEKHFGVSE
jgi:hypothetical protein